MSPPNKISSSPEDLSASCSVHEEPVSYLPPNSSSSETVIATQDGVEYVQDDARQMSYARPVQNAYPSHVLLMTAPAANSQDRRVALTLGRTLERLIGEMEQAGETIPAQAYELRDILKRGEFPTHDEVWNNPFFNQSLIDTRLDVVIHAVAVKVAADNQIHQTALALSLQHYFSQDPTNPADQDIRQGLIAALSTDTQGRQILAQAAQNSSRPVRAEIAQAAIQSRAAGAAAGAGAQAATAGGAAAGGVVSTTQPTPLQTAVATTTRVVSLSNPTANSLLTGAGLVLTALGLDRGPLPPYQESLLWPYPVGGLGNGPYVLPTVVKDLPFLNDIFRSPAPERAADSHGAEAASPSHGAPESPRAGSRPPSAPEAPPSSNPARPEGAAPGTNVHGTLPHAMQSIGAPSYATQVILAALPSPFTLAAVALQGGYAAALLGQSAAQPQHSSAYSYAPHAIAAVSSAAETHADSDSSHSDSSGNGQSGGQGQQQDENPHEERKPEQDIYLA